LPARGDRSALKVVSGERRRSERQARALGNRARRTAMVKVIFLLKFRKDLDPDEVSRWWRTDHGARRRGPGV
jgi:hypothetical protein